MTDYPLDRDSSGQRRSSVTRRMLERARREWRQRRFDAAEGALTSVLALAPEDAVAVRMLGVTAQHCGNHGQAADCFRQVLDVWPDDAGLRVGLGIALYEKGDADAAVTQFRRACELAPDVAMSWFNLGKMLGMESRFAESAEALQRALELAPDHVAAHLLLAKARAALGQIEAAVTGFREVLRREPDQAEAWFGLCSLNTVDFDAADVARLGKALQRCRTETREYELLGFTLAKALEAQDDYPRAFDVFQRANASRRRRRPQWDAAAERARVQAIGDIFAQPVPASADEQLGREVIFVVSMPRSGSTLVEQILAAHPQVQGANEIKDLSEVIGAESERRHLSFPAWAPDAGADDWLRLGREYLARTEGWRRERPRFTDKSLLNWPLVGAALAMLPAARVVVVRRDPVETCLGCYRQLFSEARGFACDLDDTADYCIDFLRLTRFWLQRHPDRVFDLEYEALVATPEPVTRQLLDFCDLPFDPACLQFHDAARTVIDGPSAAQVRQPLHGGTARAARYGDKLDPLRQRLRDAGVLAS